MEVFQLAIFCQGAGGVVTALLGCLQLARLVRQQAAARKRGRRRWLRTERRVTAAYPGA